MGEALFERGFEHLQRRTSFPQHQDSAILEVELCHGGLDADSTSSPVQDLKASPMTQIFKNVLCPCGRDVTEPVGRGRRQWHVRGAEQLEGHGMIWASHCNEVRLRGDLLGHHRPCSAHNTQGPRPDLRRQRLEDGALQAAQIQELQSPLDVGDMEDAWIVQRSPFRPKNLEDGRGIQAIGAQAVDRFRGERHQLATPQTRPERLVLLDGDGLPEDSRLIIVQRLLVTAGSPASAAGTLDRNCTRCSVRQSIKMSC
mmetsp:Transcript_33098/g.84147  ORF Transcript_33098/g.84147 Transcript_33098/m.84147 type:complete len:256 (+) Transcript_33098:719-1486(+)